MTSGTNCELARLGAGLEPGNRRPLFFTQYFFMRFDPRCIQDKYTDYFRDSFNQQQDWVSHFNVGTEPGAMVVMI